MLATLKEVLQAAEDKKIAIGAFDTPNLESLCAAIAAAEGTTTDGFVVRSIRRRPSNKWNR